MPYNEAVVLVQPAVACIDCHDGNTLALRISRPAFFRRLEVVALYARMPSMTAAPQR
jgi:nitrite reductase (cytochrome c-552)